jgi:type IV pilus assembly protein PilW
LVELLIALVLGLIMMGAFGTVFLSSKSASRRLDQLGEMQNSVRTAFEFFTNDAHSVGLTGCQQGSATGFSAPGSTSLVDNYQIPLEGYDALAVPTYPLAVSTNAGSWQNNIGGTSAAFQPGVLGSTAITSSSDVLILRIPTTRPLRLAANSTPVLLSIENVSLGGRCADGTARNSGMCTGNYALVASCSRAEVFRAQALTTGAGTIAITPSPSLANSYTANVAEVFPLQTVMYYVRVGSRPDSQSLYRRVFDGDDGTTNGEEQELLEDVESIQITYGVDTVDNADGSRNFNVDSYVTANNVADWARVIAVRMSVLMRSREPLRDAGVVLAASAPVNNVNVTFPTTGDKFDRRTFTTTVALRNRIANN